MTMNTLSMNSRMELPNSQQPAMMRSDTFAKAMKELKSVMDCQRLRRMSLGELLYLVLAPSAEAS